MKSGDVLDVHSIEIILQDDEYRACVVPGFKGEKFVIRNPGAISESGITLNGSFCTIPGLIEWCISNPGRVSAMVTLSNDNRSELVAMDFRLKL